MKKILSIMLVAAIMIITLVGCGSMEGKAYIFKCVDASGSPVKGVSLQVCSTTQCMFFETDDNGEVVCKDLPEMSYEVHVSSCPNGYSYDSEDVYTTSTTYETHTFTLSNQ